MGYSEFLNCNNLDKQMKINKSKIPAEIKKQLENARKSSFVLSNLNVTKKNQILYDLSFKLRASLSEILEENFKDIINAKKLYELGELSLSLFERVKLTESKIEQMAVYCESVAKLTNPNGKIIDATRLDIGLELYKVTCPIGVILMIFESRPDAVIQISSLGLKSGNAIILKGGKEASFSNRILVKLIRETINKISDSSVNSISLVETRVEVNELIKLSQDLDLIIPRGSNQMVQKIQSKSMVPVLGHADGICHVFLDNEGDENKSMSVVLDSKLNYPAVCNSLETLLVHKDFPDSWLASILLKMQESGVELRVCSETKNRLKSFKSLKLKKAVKQDWKTEYIDLIISVKSVDSATEAVMHINNFGSKHTDSIVTENKELAEWFLNAVDSAGVFWNASTRFADGFRYGLGAEVGVSNGKIHARGPVGLDGLVTYKYKLYGNGQGVGEYSKGNREFIHEKINL